MEGAPEGPPRTNLDRSGGRAPWIVALLVLAALGGYGLWRWLAPGEAPVAVQQPAAPPAPEPAAAATAVTAPGEPPASAEEAPALAERVSAHPLVRRGIAPGDLVRRWVVVTENLAQGDSPRRELPFLAPRAPFAVVKRGDGLAAAPGAWARYDELAAAVASVDARAAAAAYHRLHGVLDAAFAALGYRAGSLDAATVRALRRVAEAPLAKEGTRLVQAEGVYVYEDPKLEQLPELEKHLLRLGPRNQALVQAKARELLAELKLPGAEARR